MIRAINSESPRNIRRPSLPLLRTEADVVNQDNNMFFLSPRRTDLSHSAPPSPLLIQATDRVMQMQSYSANAIQNIEDGVKAVSLHDANFTTNFDGEDGNGGSSSRRNSVPSSQVPQYIRDIFGNEKEELAAAAIAPPLLPLGSPLRKAMSTASILTENTNKPSSLGAPFCPNSPSRSTTAGSERSPSPASVSSLNSPPSMSPTEAVAIPAMFEVVKCDVLDAALVKFMAAEKCALCLKGPRVNEGKAHVILRCVNYGCDHVVHYDCLVKNTGRNNMFTSGHKMATFNTTIPNHAAGYTSGMVNSEDSILSKKGAYTFSAVICHPISNNVYAQLGSGQQPCRFDTQKGCEYAFFPMNPMTAVVRAQRARVSLRVGNAATGQVQEMEGVFDLSNHLNSNRVDIVLSDELTFDNVILGLQLRNDSNGEFVASVLYARVEFGTYPVSSSMNANTTKTHRTVTFDPALGAMSPTASPVSASEIRAFGYPSPKLTGRDSTSLPLHPSIQHPTQPHMHHGATPRNAHAFLPSPEMNEFGMDSSPHSNASMMDRSYPATSMGMTPLGLYSDVSPSFSHNNAQAQVRLPSFNQYSHGSAHSSPLIPHMSPVATPSSYLGSSFSTPHGHSHHGHGMHNQWHPHMRNEHTPSNMQSPMSTPSSVNTGRMSLGSQGRQHSFPTPGSRFGPPGFTPMHNMGGSGRMNDYLRRGDDSSSSMRRGDESVSDRDKGPVVDPDTPLVNLKGRLLAMAKTQNGSRYVQRQLSRAGPEDVEFIFNEIREGIADLMTDSYGNYMCQRMFQSCSANQRLQLLQTMSPRMVDVACDRRGTHALQTLIELVNMQEEEQVLIDSLTGHVITLSMNAQGTHVVQRILLCLRESSCYFIFEPVLDNMLDIGHSAHGLCVIKRCITQIHNKDLKAAFIEQLTKHALELVQSPYGNYAIQHAIESWGGSACRSVFQQMLGRVMQLSMQKFSSNVVEKCIQYADSDFQAMFLEELTKSDKMGVLMQSSYGNYVVQKALSIADRNHCIALIKSIENNLHSLHDKKLRQKWEQLILDSQGGVVPSHNLAY
eukprot:GILJ01000810.1.p1 GENE.GILJ01000810.1~~GILJ01000810.1.p1  ORF type:complete len:1060 (+),score=180.51 GILJ01000810.1:230-3409(+)